MMPAARFVLTRLLPAWLFVLAVTSSMAAGPDLKQFSFLPHWSPQAQFAGYYMALHKGIYRQHGIDLTIIQGGPRRSTVEYLRNRQTDVATLWLSSALQLIDHGVEIVNVGQVIQRSSLVLVTKKSSGIETPQQINGKKIALWPADFQIQPDAFFKKFRLQNRIVTTENPVNLFLRDGVHVASVMWYNEYHTLINSGLDPEEMRLFFFDDIGLNFPEDGIYLRKDTFDADPQAACAFVAASLEGWQYAFSHPEETLDHMIAVMEEAHIVANRVHQRWMLERMRDLIFAASDASLMVLRAEDYQRVGDVLLGADLIHSLPAYASFFKNCVRHAER
jgi:NitT/TauT family transport system substrate-binding protein